MTKFEASLLSVIENHADALFRVDFDGTGFHTIEFEEHMTDTLNLNAGDWLIHFIDDNDDYDYYHYEKALEYFSSHWIKGISKLEMQAYVGIELNDTEMKCPSIEVSFSFEKYNFLRNTPLTEEQKEKLNRIVSDYLISIKNGTDKD